MNSRRVLVLDFVRDYLAEHGVSPSYSEIAAGVGADRMAVKRAIRSLVADGLMIQTPGARGLAMPGSEADAIRQLRALGWTVNPLASPIGPGTVTKETLLPPAALDYPGPVASEGAERGESIGRPSGPGTNAD